MSNFQTTLYFEQLVENLQEVLSQTREEPTLSIEVIAEIIKEVLGEDTQFLIKELSKHMVTR
jgi:hypothetical protein|tara:strand:+ start:1909 stop:2094 length:186 start_codon:yes stop_codon:yes gene_type:complete